MSTPNTKEHPPYTRATPAAANHRPKPSKAPLASQKPGVAPAKAKSTVQGLRKQHVL